MAARKTKPRKKKATRYKTAEAKKMGLGPTKKRHGASRNPKTGLLFKLPGHDTLHKSVKADRQAGYETVQRGKGMASYKRGDPRLRAGSTSARRDRDISGAVWPGETKSAIKAGKAPRTAARRKKRSGRKKK